MLHMLSKSFSTWFMITFKTLLLFANSLKHTVAVLNEHLEALGKKYETMVQKTVDTR